MNLKCSLQLRRRFREGDYMEVKEFAHKVSGDKIEKEFKFMGRTIK